MKGETFFAIIVLILSLVTLGALVYNEGCDPTEEQVMMEEAERALEN